MFWKTFRRGGGDGETGGGGMEKGVLQRFLPGMPV